MSNDRSPGLISELKRRGVIRVGLAYLLGSWLIIQIGDTLFPYFGVPASAVTRMIVILAVGFVPALVLSWVFEWTPRGITRDAEIPISSTLRRSNTRRIDFAIIIMLTIAVALFSFDRFVTPFGRAPVVVIANESPAVAVLPFENRSALNDDIYFVDGVHDDILTSLAKISALRVISRTSVEQYENMDRNLRDIGAELGVTSILEGSVQRAGDRIRINVQLIDVATDSHQWAETYERELTTANIFAIQNEISNTIAQALAASLLPEEQNRIAQVPTENLDAYEAYLLGNHRLKRRRGTSVQRAVEYFQEAVNLDPEFALAHVGLANSYILLRSYSNREWEDLRPLAMAAAENAVSLDPNLGEAYASLGMIHSESREFLSAEPHFIRAIELSPNYATGRQWFAEYQAKTRRLGESLEQIEIAIQLDPLSPIINHIYASRLLDYDRLDEAEARWKKAIEVDPEFARAFQGLSAFYFTRLNRFDDAAIFARKATQLNPEVASTYALLANIFLSLGDTGEAKRWLAEAARLDPNGGPTVFVSMVLDAQQGNLESAAAIANSSLQHNPQNPFDTTIIAEAFVRRGEFDNAIATFEASFPGLANDDSSILDARSVNAATFLAQTLLLAGRHSDAARVIEKIQEFLDRFDGDRSQLGQQFDVRFLAVSGETEEALAALSNAIESGWRRFALLMFESHLAFRSLWGTPEYVEIRQTLVDDLEDQRRSLSVKWDETFN